MKKCYTLFLSILCCFSILLVSASALGSEDTAVLVSSTQINLSDGGYIIEEIVETKPSTIARTTNNKSGYKTITRYTASGSAVYAVQVTGEFSYTGSSSWATSATATVYTYTSNASFVSKSASYSGNTAYATGTVKYAGITESRRPSLSCDKNGNLS